MIVIERKRLFCIEALSERSTFFSLQVYERVGILQDHVFEKVEKSVIELLEGPSLKYFQQTHLMAVSFNLLKIT